MWRNLYVDAVQVFSDVRICWILHQTNHGGNSCEVRFSETSIMRSKLIHYRKTIRSPASVTSTREY
jgi:hypothetical protein